MTARSLLSCCLSRDGRNVPILHEKPGRRWTKLTADGGADWAAWCDRKHGGTPKRHREYVWWSSLLAANRRIFLLHAVAFAACSLVAERIDFPARDATPLNCIDVLSGRAACKQPWQWWWYAPAVCLLPAVCATLGRICEWRSHQTSTAFASVRNATLWLICHGCLAAIVWDVQTRISFCEFQCLLVCALGPQLQTAGTAPSLPPPSSQVHRCAPA